MVPLMDLPLSGWGYGLAPFRLGILRPLLLFVMELSIVDTVFYTSQDSRDSKYKSSALGTRRANTPPKANSLHNMVKPPGAPVSWTVIDWQTNGHSTEDPTFGS